MTLSYSSLKAFIESPNHFLLYKERKEASQQMRQGSLVDVLLFTPSEFDSKYAVDNIDKRTKEGKVKFIDYQDKGIEVITPEQFNEAKDIVKSIESNTLVQDLLYGLEYQKKVEGKIFDVDFVGYADAYCTYYIMDLKTTKNASAREFNRSIYNFKYHLQAAIYMHLSGAKDFYWIAVESAQPYNCEVYKCSDEWKDKGFQLLYKAMEDFNRWDGKPKGYNNGVIDLIPESWMK